jgi:hypothetical protein
MKKVLFVAYGSGHIKMLLPVAQALKASGRATPILLALTTAAPVARKTGLDVIQFKDFIRPSDQAALAKGHELMLEMKEPIDDPEETTAYLGLSFEDLVRDRGIQSADAEYRLRGRQAFLPTGTLIRILQKLRPDVVVATSAPRAERAAIVASGQLGIPAICLVDLFAINSIQWIGEPGYAQRVCVLNNSVRDFFIAKGRKPDEIVVTGNPGFDALNVEESIQAGQILRKKYFWSDKLVILWPTQVEPAVHPFGKAGGNPLLPENILDKLIVWVVNNPKSILCVRPRAGEVQPNLPAHQRILLTGQDWPLAPLLHATDLVVTLTSTVGLEGYLTGCRVIQITGSIFDDSMPFMRYGIADVSVSELEISATLDCWAGVSRRQPASIEPATLKVLSEIFYFL